MLVTKCDACSKIINTEDKYTVTLTKKVSLGNIKQEYDLCDDCKLKLEVFLGLVKYTNRSKK